MDSYVYLYEDFARDFDAMNPSLNAAPRDEIQFLFQIRDYMKAKYPKEIDQMERGTALGMAFSFLNKNPEKLDFGRAAVRGKDLTMISEHLLKAVHSLVCFAAIHCRPAPTPGEVLAFAEKLADDEAKREQA